MYRWKTHRFTEPIWTGNENVDKSITIIKVKIKNDNVKKQIQSWSDDEVKKMIYKINDIEILVKKNSNNSLNFISDFVSNY